MLYPLNPCGHLRGPGGGCKGYPEYKHEPVSADRLGELAQRAGELSARRGAHSSRALTRDQRPEVRTLVTDKLESAISLAECLSAALASLFDDKAVMTTEEQATEATIGANMERWRRELHNFLTT